MPSNKAPATYRLVIIGAGLTGLSTALAWTRVYPDLASEVLVLEKNPVPGGCVTTFARKGFRFDTTQIIPDVSDVLKFFGLDIPMVRFDPVYARLFLPDLQTKGCKVIPIESSREAFESSLIERYPGDTDAIKQFFSYCQSMYDELAYLKTEPKLKHIPGILLHCQKILANSNKTYAQFLDRFHFNNAELRQVLDTFSSFSGLSGDRCAALLTACAMMTTLHGSYRPTGGFIQFPVAMRKALEQTSAHVRTECEVTKILVEHGRATGVQLADGEIIHADHVISTADTKVTCEQLLSLADKPKGSYFRTAEQARMSPSGFSIQLGLDDEIDLKGLGYDCGYNLLTSSPDAYQKIFDAWDQGEQLMSDDCFHLAVICPSILTGGKPTLIVHAVPAPAEKWIELRRTDKAKYDLEKQKIAEFYTQKVEEYMIPDLKKHIVFTDISTPATYCRYLGSPTGSQFDMLPVPGNFGKNRLPTRTPIQGLFIPKFSHGIWPSLQAGLQVVDMITGGRIMNGNSSLS